MKRRTAAILTAPASALVAGCVLGPIVLLVRMSLYQQAAGRGFFTPGTVSLQNYISLIDAHDGIVAFTLFFGCAVSALSLGIGYPLALFLVSLRRREQFTALALILTPKTAGLLATLFGLQRWLPRGLSASLVGETCLVLPYVVLVLFIQLRAMDPALAEAARGLGASPWQAFRRVTLPVSLPGVVLAAELALMWGLGAFLGPLFLGGPEEHTLSVELHRQAFDYGRWPLAAAQAVVLMLLTAGLLAAVAGLGSALLPAATRRTRAREVRA